MEPKTKVYLLANSIIFIALLSMLLVTIHDRREMYQPFAILSVGGLLIQFYFLLKKLND